MNTLNGKRVVVFGGGSGAGLAAAKRLADDGAEVIVASRNVAQVETDLARYAGRMSAESVDGQDVEAVEAFFTRVGEFDHLVITAGATNRGGEFIGITDEAFRATFDGKFWVQITAARAGARHIRSGGSITLFSGGASRRALHGMANIAAVNGAIDAVVPTLALELGPTRVNSISPGTLRTTYWTGVPDETLDAIMNRMANALPAGRVGTADDIAQAVHFVVTNPYINGTTLCVDGGLPHASFG